MRRRCLGIGRQSALIVAFDRPSSPVDSDGYHLHAHFFNEAHSDSPATAYQADSDVSLPHRLDAFGEKIPHVSERQPIHESIRRLVLVTDGEPVFPLTRIALPGRVRVALHHSTQQPLERVRKRAQAMQRTDSILVVDSEPTIVDLLVELLTDAGYRVLTASDYARALYMSITYAPALLLLDMHMPHIQASELIAQLRRDGVATLPIVLMTTQTRAGELLPVPGAMRYLAKPFDIDDVLACVADFVQPINTASTIHTDRAQSGDSA